MASLRPFTSFAVRQGLLRCLVTGLCSAGIAAADAPPAVREPPVDLTELSLQELMDIQVTSVSKRAEPISEAAAAVFVLTQEDLRRSGATSIPEALRLVPGLEVARIDANKWAISARGFNGRFANKLLVLIDGRSVYTPLFSGVFWDVQDTLIEDIERIEVIRGPGATLWGANAVNGVINILTRAAGETQGGLVAAGGGSEERGFASVRYGGSFGNSSSYRVYGKTFERGSGLRLTGGAAADDWSMSRLGFRVDSGVLATSHLMVEGELYDGEEGETLARQSLLDLSPQTVDDETGFAGGHLLGKWQRTLASGSELRAQVYLDRTRRDTLSVDERRDTFDLELQHGLSPSAKQRLLWGLGLRRTSDEITTREVLSFRDNRRTDDLASAFLQDEIALLPERLWVTLGTKVEHNDYTGFEIQPNVRTVWKPRLRHTLWAAASRAVRTPSRAEHDLTLAAEILGPGELFPGAPPTVVTSFGDPSFESEELLAWEAGYRAGLGADFFVDLATFYNDYDQLRSARAEQPFLVLAPFPHFVLPVRVGNDLEGETYGGELALDWRAAKHWRWSFAYSYLEVELRDTQQAALGEPLEEGSTPRHQLVLRSSLDLPLGVELDAALRFVDELRLVDVDSYTTLDLRLGWQARPGLELSIVGQNLLEEDHLEFSPEIIPTHPTAVERGVYGKVAWRF